MTAQTLTRRGAAARLALLAAAPLALPRTALAQGIAPATADDVRRLAQAARAEGHLASVGMPDDWADWKDTWADLSRLYGIQHVDTDMSSAEEIAKMAAERANATVDMGDIGFEFAPIAKARGITRAYKPSTWAQVPDWAKDPDGHWALAYTGTIAFAVNKRRVTEVPRTWKALFASQARVNIGEVGRAAQAGAGVLAAAIALGGDETNLAPALADFGKIARRHGLVTVNGSPALMERGEADVFVLWDFNALSYRTRIPNAADYEVLIPADGSVTSGYSTILNAHAPHPAAAQLAREYIFSDAGQTNLARGHARPIRSATLALPADVRRGLVEEAQYRAARPVRPALWTEQAKQLPRAWQHAVMGA